MQSKEEKNTDKKYSPHREPIAIVGMSCRFPQAPDLESFWELLSTGKNTITEIPPDRWKIADYYDADPTAGCKTNQRHASMLDHIHDFDPLFFSISPAEAAEMNPSQKLMLELVWEAIEHAGVPYKKVQGKKAGVYIGNIWSDFEHHRKHKNSPVTSHSAMGQSANIIANRVSFAFGFTGPSLVVDTGCSSSLVALHLGCQSLWDDSTEMSVVAGVNHILDPDQYILLSKFGGLSSTGKCSTFDADADGFVRGEGAGVVLLKKLSQAEKDGDTICAVIRGSAVNNNGYNLSLPATSVSGQKEMLADAYEFSGIAPHEVHYVEAHGTGTKLGDPTESRALGEFFAEQRDGTHLHIGSVKTNIGHLEGAAGMAGLIKVVLAMHHKKIPPSLNFRKPNPAIPFDKLKLNVQHELGSWPAQDHETLKAGVNSFGWGGTNAHVVIEEYRSHIALKENSIQATRHCLPLSAKSTPALKEYARAYVQLIQESSEDEFKRICLATAIVKPALDHRLLFTANEKNEMTGALKDFIEDDTEVTPKSPTESGKIVMVFPGQGSQWIGMGQELYKIEPDFRNAMNECHEAFKPYTHWSLKEQLNASENTSQLHEIDVVQPMLFAVQISLARLWMSWGIQPHAVVGHSMGEVAAAHISGALSLDDAARIICTRSRLMRTVSGKGGAMAMTELSIAEAEKIIKRYPELSIAVSNSPKSTVLAGRQDSIDIVLDQLNRKDLFCRLVKVDVASHSKQMDPLKEELRQSVQCVKPSPNSIPMYSTVRGRLVTGEELAADYWTDNLRNTVQFNSVVDQLLNDGHTFFIEVSPHPVLTNAVSECARHINKSAMTFPSLFREKPEQESIYKNLGGLYAGGYDIDWEAFYRTDHPPKVKLPSYPFQRICYELEDKSAELSRARSSSLLGNAIYLADSETQCFWETSINLDMFPYLRDHQVNGTIVLPGAAYVEMILEAAHEVYPSGNPVISQISFLRSITLTGKETSTIQLKFTVQNKVSVFQFFIKSVQTADRPSWELLAKGELRIAPSHEQPVYISDGDATAISGASFYESLTSLGLQYGGYFQNIRQLFTSERYPDKIHFTLVADNRLLPASGQYKVHPALLDSFFQPLFFKAVDDTRQSNCSSFLTDIGEVIHFTTVDPATELRGVATLKPLKKDEHRGLILSECDIDVFSSSGEAVMKIKGLKGKTIDTRYIEQRKEKLKDWLYSVQWIRSEKTIVKQNVSRTTWVVIGDPYGVSGILIEKMNRQNISCIHVTPGKLFSKVSDDHYTICYEDRNDYQKLMEALYHGDEKKITGILHAGSMNYTWQDPYLTADRVEEQQIYGSISFMYLHQQLERMKPAELPKLIILTNGIQAVGHDHHVAQPVHSPLWGMVKVMFNELTHYHCRYFDLSASPAMEELDQVISEMNSDDPQEKEIVLRGADQYVPRLGVPVNEDIPVACRKQFSSTGTYLVTGFRALGFVFIEWMIRQGARNFALLSRTGEASADVLERISVLERQGCQFRIFKTDTGNYDELKSVIEIIEMSMTGLKGVIHAAGVIEARKLIDLDPTEFLRILNPKVKGAWNLHLLTQNKPLDCFIMFSSASTLIGLSGQGSYVAANAFLDTLAHCRKQMGLPGMSVNWGVIKDVGMVANKAALERYARAEGFEPVTMHDAMEVFNLIYDSDYTQIGIVKLDAESVASYYTALGKTRYFNGLLRKEKNVKSQESHFPDYFVSLDTHEERVTALEQFIVRHVATVVKTSASHIKTTMTFKGLGIDSLMSIQLWNLLERNLGLKLTLAMFWSHPCIQDYIVFLCGLLEAQLLTKQSGEKISINSHVSAGWFAIPKPNPLAKYRVFCFHDAGGNASLYHSWENFSSDHFEFVPVELPGHGNRSAEMPHADLSMLIQELMPAITPMLDKPFCFFGHSMGGLIAFELTRELRRTNSVLPSRIFISSTPGLTTYSRDITDPTLSREEIIALFPHLDNDNIGDESLQQMLLNLLRTDLQLINTYEYVGEEPLNVPLVVIHGISDDWVKAEQAEQWRRETTASFKVISRPGGHRYIEDDAEFLTSLIRKSIQPTKTESLYERVY